MDQHIYILRALIGHTRSREIFCDAENPPGAVPRGGQSDHIHATPPTKKCHRKTERIHLHIIYVCICIINRLLCAARDSSPLPLPSVYCVQITPITSPRRRLKYPRTHPAHHSPGYEREKHAHGTRLVSREAHIVGCDPPDPTHTPTTHGRQAVRAPVMAI